MTNQQKWKRLCARLDEMGAYRRSLGKLSFDMSCCAPEEGMEQAGKDMAALGRRLHQLSHAPGYEKLLCELHADSDGLSELQQKAVEHLHKRYARGKNISEALSYEMSLASSRAYADWLRAKKASDFSQTRGISEPYLFFRNCTNLAFCSLLGSAAEYNTAVRIISSLLI